VASLQSNNRFDVICNELAMTGVMVTLVAEKTDGSTVQQFHNLRHCRFRRCACHDLSIDGSKLIVVPSASSLASRLRIAEIFQVNVLDPSASQRLAQRRLREASAPGLRPVSDIDNDVDINSLERGQKVVQPSPFVSDRRKHH